MSASLQANLDWLTSTVGQPADLQTTDITLKSGSAATLFFLEGMTEVTLLHQGIINPLQTAAGDQYASLDELAEQVIRSPGFTATLDPRQAIDLFLRGQALLLVDGLEGALLLNIRGGASRRPEEPTNEASVRGPRDGFVEALSINRSLIRRRLANPALRFETVEVGKQSQTRVELAYLEDRAPKELVAEVRKRLKKIETTGVLDSGVIEEWIEDNPYSPFPHIENTSRPDKAVAGLLAGRVAVLVDQSPSVLLAPTVFWHMLHVPEDYYERWWAASFIRILRALALFISFTLPSLWVMLIAYHQELIPTALALSVAGGRERVPLPGLIEALGMEITFEILREAGARLPRSIGQTVSIVGALVIGQAAVQAGLVSPANVIVVAMTGLASFSTPSFSAAYAFRILRFAMMLSAGIFGILGFGFMWMLILVHLLGLKSFGVDFLSPVLPYEPGAVREVVFRPQWRWLRTQPKRWWTR